MNFSKRIVNQIIFALIVLFSIAGGWSASEFYKSKKHYNESENKISINFSLIDQNGTPVTENTYKGKNKI